MTQNRFGLSVAKFAAKAGANANAVIRVAALDMLSRIVLRTPVDEGRARGNWQVTINAPAGNTIDRLDKTGDMTIAAGSGAIARAVAGPSIWITNNLPYIVKLEYGYSSKAPSGMVRVTQREWKGVIGAAVSKVRK